MAHVPPGTPPVGDHGGAEIHRGIGIRHRAAGPLGPTARRGRKRKARAVSFMSQPALPSASRWGCNALLITAQSRLLLHAPETLEPRAYPPRNTLAAAWLRILCTRSSAPGRRDCAPGRGGCQRDGRLAEEFGQHSCNDLYRPSVFVAGTRSGGRKVYWLEVALITWRAVTAFLEWVIGLGLHAMARLS